MQQTDRDRQTHRLTARETYTQTDKRGADMQRGQTRTYRQADTYIQRDIRTERYRDRETENRGTCWTHTVRQREKDIDRDIDTETEWRDVEIERDRQTDKTDI